MGTVSILLADDHALIRKGLRQTLERNADFQITEAENGEEALSIIRDEKPQIAILDIEMPLMTGFEVAQCVHNEGLNVDIVFLTMYKDDTMFNNAMDIGVKGYVLKENTVLEIVQCVNAVREGKSFISPAISDLLIRRNSKLRAPASDQLGLNQLTPAERRVMRQVAQMKTNQEIAQELHISDNTVKNHRTNICNKLGLSGAHSLLKFALEHQDKF